MGSNKFRIITDSAADLPIEFIKEFDVGVVSHQVIINGNIMKLGPEVDKNNYYALLEKLPVIPESSTPTPEDFYKCFKESFDKGYNGIIYVSVSEALTATLHIARVATKKFSADQQKRIIIIDSSSASGVQGLIIILIKQLLKRFPVKKVVEMINDIKRESVLVVGFHSLRNVYKSGRLKSKTLLRLSEFLRIKPVAVMITPPGKLKSSFPGFITERSMEKRLLSLILRKIDYKKSYDVLISHVRNLQGAKRLLKDLEKKIKIDNKYITEASPIIGTNTGKGTIIASLLPSLRNFV